MSALQLHHGLTAMVPFSYPSHKPVVYNCFTQLIRQHIDRHAYNDIETDIAFIQLLFNGINGYDFSRHFKLTFGATASQSVALRSAVQGNGYLLMSLKPYLFRCWKKGIFDKHTCQKIAKQYGVLKSDAHLVRRLLTSQVAPTMVALDKYKALSATKLKQVMNRIPKEIEPFAASMTYRKLRFIYRNPHNGKSKDDLISDVELVGIQAVMRTYPRIDCFEHALNIARRTCHNGGLNILYSHTRQSRAETIQMEDGTFQYRIKEIDPASVETSSDTHLQIESEIFINDLICLMNHAPLRQIALRCMAGLHDVGFSDWLMTKAYARHRQPNNVLLDHLLLNDDYIVYEGYMKRYLNITDDQLDNFKLEVGRLIEA